MGREAEAEKCKKQLKEWGKRPENKHCADCGLKQPGWASTNIGVIVCIHCSGIHRKLGVHISFVKSLTLDSWTTKLTKSFVSHGGNVAINKMYEANLPRGIKPTDPTDMRRLETFVRNKYEYKKWYSAKGKKKKKKKKRQKAISDSESEDEDEDSSDSESSEPKQKTKKVDKGDRTRKSKRSKRRPRPAPAKKASAKKTAKKESLSKPVKLAVPAEDVPNLLNFTSMKLQTTEPEESDGFGLFSDFSPKQATSPPSFLPGMSDQPPGPAPPSNPNAIDPFQPNAVQQVETNMQMPQSAADKVMNLFKQTQQPQQKHQANVFTQLNGPSPGFGSNFNQRQNQTGFPQQQQQMGFNQRQNQTGFPQQQQQMGFKQRQNQTGFPQQQQQTGFRGFQQPQQGFGTRPNQMGFQQQNQRNFRSPILNQQQPMSGFPPQQQQQQNAFSSFGNVNAQNQVLFPR